MNRKILGAAGIAVALVFTGMAPAYAVAPDGWSAPITVSVSGQDADSPEIVAAPNGTLLTVWSRYNGSNYIIQTSTSSDHGATWAAPQDVSAAGQDAFLAHVTVAPDGTFSTVWSRSNGSNNIIQTSTSLDNGATWSAPANLSAAGQDASSPQIIAAPDGSSLTAVWHREGGGNATVQTATSLDSGATWSSAANLSVAGQDAYVPQVTAALSGTLAIVWHRSDGSNWIIQSSTSLDNGVTWSAPADLSAPGQDALFAEVGAAPDNTLTAIWHRHNGTHNIIQTSSSTDNGATWGAPTDLSAVGQNAIFPQVTAAPNNTVIAVWSRHDGSNVITQTSSSTNHGATWSTPTGLSAAGQDASAPQIIAASDGTLAVIWPRSDGSNYVVQATTSVDNGGTWTAPANLSASGQDVFAPQIAVTPDGTFTTVWSRSDGSNQIIQSAFGTMAPVITSGTPPAAEVDTAYSFLVTASGIPAPTFVVSGGALPGGLSLSPSGQLSGTPTVFGDFTFTVTAANGTAPDATATYTLSVSRAALVATGVDPAPLVAGGLLALVLGAALTYFSRTRLLSKRKS